LLTLTILLQFRPLLDEAYLSLIKASLDQILVFSLLFAWDLSRGAFPLKST